MAAAVAARSVLRSATISARASTSRIAAGTKPARSPFRIPTQKPLSHRIFRSPVEMSSVNLGSLFPLHTATASALLTSMLSTAPYSCGWTIDGEKGVSGQLISSTYFDLPILPPPLVTWKI